MKISQFERYALAAQEDRCAPRALMGMPAQLRASGTENVQTSIRDLSTSGFSASVVRPLAPGTICWITFPGRKPMQACVVWWENNIAGCAFASIMEQYMVDELINP